MKNNDPYFKQILNERGQSHETRTALFKQLEKELDKPVISFFASFIHAESILSDQDADMLEGLLQSMDLSKGFALVISSPGGSGLAAERMISICRAYSGNNFDVLIPGKAKSAATMVCFGANKIYMGCTSELGPIDPQITLVENGEKKRYSVFNLVKSYENLFRRAAKAKGNIQPYLQQLTHYDERDIAEFKAAMELSEDIAIKSLKSGMLSSKSETEIKKSIKIFLTPESTKTHGRPIYRDEALKCGLVVEEIDKESSLWKNLRNLYIRSDSLVSTNVIKCLESRQHSFAVSK